MIKRYNPMYTITVNIYKYDQFKWQEQVLLDASSKAEAKQKTFYRLDEIHNLEKLKKNMN